MDRHEVLSTKQYLSHIGEWPRIPSEVHVDRWLKNFEPEELEHAVALLEALIFVSSRQTRALLRKSIHALSSEWCASFDTYAAKQTAWAEFLETVLITFPTGEDPNVTDSGYAFARMARKELGIPDSRCLPPDEVVTALAHEPSTPVIFVDDFVGSGNQLMETWRRAVHDFGRRSSLQDLAAAGGTRWFYVPLACTSYAQRRLDTEAPQLKLRPGYLITDEYSAIHRESVVFPDHLRSTARDFIENASKRGDIVDMPLGFHERALALAFEDSVPDASLEMIWHEGAKWTALMPRN